MDFSGTVLSAGEWAVPVVFAVVLHEIAHGYAALCFGDTTARDMKRLSLNPLRHVDPVGTVLFPLILILTSSPFVFGWAKPVPVNFARLRHPKKDMVWVALAGPAMNLFQALCAFFVLSVCKNVLHTGLPIEIQRFLLNIIVLNLSVMTFNLIPVLPMDGGRIVTGLLPLKWAVRFAKTERYGFGIIAFLLILLPVLGNYIGRDLDIVSRFLAITVQNLASFFVGFFGLGEKESIMGIGFFQLLIILLIVLVLFGRGKLPALAEDLGKSVSAFKKGLNGDKEEEKKEAPKEENKTAENDQPKKE
ncbi:MAG: twin-arginine translocase TatA/TatE family subunit [Alphaproteobacteria bacterium]|nr:twin-arginine translocase TatA/TatE family subunit [Alphaproteobacteria bacterium]